MALGNSWTNIASGSQTVNGATLTYYIDAKLNSQSVGNNQSVCDTRARTVLSDYSYMQSYGYNFTATGCTTKSGSGLYNFTTETVLEGSTTVTHNADGTGTLSISGACVGSGIGLNISISGSVALPTIPRASVPTLNKSSMILDGVNTVTITTNRKSTSFTHTVTMSSGSESYSITNVGASTTWTPSMGRWMPVMGNSSSITITITCTTYNGSTQIGSAQSVTMALTKDTRASTASFDKTNITLDGNNQFNVTITRAISAFTHTITYARGGHSFESTGVGTSTVWKPSVSGWMPYCDVVKNAITVSLKTYNSGYQIGNTKIYTIYLTVDTSTYKPTIGTITLSETNTAVSAVMPSGSFVQGLSNLSASIPFGVTNTSYVTLASGKAELGTQKTQSWTLSGTSSTKTLTQSALTATSLKVTVTDSRGVTATKTQSISVREYSELAIVSASVQRTNSSGTPSSSGGYCKYTVVVSVHTGAYGSSNNKITLQWRYKKHSVSTWSSWANLSVTDTGNGTGYTTTYTLTRTVGEGTFDNVQYDIQFRASDLFMTKNTANMILYEGIPVYSWGADHFDVFGNFHIHDRTDPTIYTQIRPRGMILAGVDLADCDDATLFGVRYRAVSDTLNKPTNAYYQIYVFPYSVSYQTQVAFQTNTQTPRIFVRSNDDNGWGAWKEVTLS